MPINKYEDENDYMIKEKGTHKMKCTNFSKSHYEFNFFF